MITSSWWRTDVTVVEPATTKTVIKHASYVKKVAGMLVIKQLAQHHVHGYDDSIIPACLVRSNALKLQKPSLYHITQFELGK